MSTVKRHEARLMDESDVIQVRTGAKYDTVTDSGRELEGMVEAVSAQFERVSGSTWMLVEVPKEPDRDEDILGDDTYRGFLEEAARDAIRSADDVSTVLGEDGRVIAELVSDEEGL